MSIGGRFHTATLPKTVGTLIGYVTARRCQANAPRGFAGVLPNIVSVGISVIRLSLITTGIFGECLIRSEASNPASFNLNLSGGRVRTIGSDSAARIPGTGPCSMNRFTLRGADGFTAFTVRLI